MRPFSMRLPFLLACLATSSFSAWQDDFDSLDTGRWLIQLYTFPANGCNMRADNLRIDDSMLDIHVTRATDTTDRKWDGGDLGDQQYRTYGLFRTRTKPSALKGSVSAFYIMNKWVATNWEHKEIDIEFLGMNPTGIQLTTHDFQNGGTVWKSDSKTVDLGFDFSRDFHEYAILWRPDTVFWFADGKLLHKTGKYVPQVGLETRMNFYVGNPDESGVLQWLGPIDTSGIPAVTRFDWVRFDPLDSLPAPYRAWSLPTAIRDRRPHAAATSGSWFDSRGRRRSLGTGHATRSGSVLHGQIPSNDAATSILVLP